MRLLWIVLWTALLVPTGAAALDNCDELAPAAAEAEIQPTFTLHQGVEGMWFALPAAKLVLCEVQTLRVLRVDLQAANRSLEIWSHRGDLLQEQVDLAVAAEARMTGVVQTADRRARAAEQGQLAAESELDAWYRSPTLWAAIGAAIVIVLEVVALVIFEKVK